MDTAIINRPLPIPLSDVEWAALDAMAARKGVSVAAVVGSIVARSLAHDHYAHMLLPAPESQSLDRLEDALGQGRR
jgi:hypothetical protein